MKLKKRNQKKKTVTRKKNEELEGNVNSQYSFSGHNKTVDNVDSRIKYCNALPSDQLLCFIYSRYAS